MSTSKFVVALFVWLLVGVGAVRAEPSEQRIALVIGNANYKAGALPTPANDAGLIAQTLQAAGFDVTGARDLDQESLRRTFREFLDKASAAGPDTVALVYLGGYGVQLEGENYFVPVDARIARDVNVPAEAVRLSDYTAPLAALKMKATLLVFDLARANPFARTGSPLTGGLALVEPDPGTLVAFNSAPGTVAPDEAGPYSAYAEALAEMMREGGLPTEDLFARARLRVNETTQGAQVPWNASKLAEPFYFFERAPDAPPPTLSREQVAAVRSRPIRDFDAQEAYLAAVDRDRLEDYEAFLAAYPDDPMARRVRAIVAARREALTWRRTRDVNTPSAYWSYLDRYPRGAHADDARRRLAYLSAAFEPPPAFAPIPYDVPPPLPAEIVYVERPVLMYGDPRFGFAQPPPSPVMFLPPRPVYFIAPPPPPPPVHAYVLPVPVYSPVPVWVRRPAYVAPPPRGNIIYNNIHNTVVVNRVTNVVTITNPAGQAQTIDATPRGARPGRQGPSGARNGAPATVPRASAAALVAPSLPSSLATRAAFAPDAATARSARPGQTARPPAQGTPLPLASPGGSGNTVPGTSPAVGTPRPVGRSGTYQQPRPSSSDRPAAQTPPGASGQMTPRTTQPSGMPAQSRARPPQDRRQADEPSNRRDWPSTGRHGQPQGGDPGFAARGAPSSADAMRPPRTAPPRTSGGPDQPAVSALPRNDTQRVRNARAPSGPSAYPQPYRAQPGPSAAATTPQPPPPAARPAPSPRPVAPPPPAARPTMPPADTSPAPARPAHAAPPAGRRCVQPNGQPCPPRG